MPNSESASETNCTEPRGSSKRKRKQSIKRNVISDGEADCVDALKNCKLEKNYGKRSRSLKIKQETEPLEEFLRNDGQNNQIECTESLMDRGVKAGGEKIEKQKLKVKGSDLSKCGSSKQQCQNCKFCSEHSIIKTEVEDSGKGKKAKKKFPCDICAKTFGTIEKHKQHMAAVHEICNDEIKRFECTDCPETVWFPTKSKFTYHLGTKHPGIIKFICEVCTETFKLKANYKNHMKSHNIVVQKKFSCDVCNGTFVNKAGYEAHKRRFPGPHIKQSCSHCGFSFSREKHLINHRCKTLLLEEAAARANSVNVSDPIKDFVQHTEDSPKLTTTDVDNKSGASQLFLADKKVTEITAAAAATPTITDSDLLQKKALESDSQPNKRVVLHRIIPRRNQDPAVYRSLQMQTQNVPESVVVQELREIDFENGTFIAAPGETEQQFIVRDINGQIVQGGQILQLDINDVQQGEESQVFLTDWNIVAPYVIREKSP